MEMNLEEGIYYWVGVIPLGDWICAVKFRLATSIEYFC
jgi:hypothetical protein